MAERVYLTKDGDMVDAVAFSHYGRSDGTTEAVYRANPGLAARGARLPAGVRVTLPEVEAPRPADTVRIWD